MSTQTVEEHAPLVVARPDHNLSRARISANAIKVLYRLHRAGYLAYLVGGGVRDILLGVEPKDFDIGTNARPQEIRRLFRNSRIIGRRFRLVHVLFHGETVEVSTFRASPEPPDEPPGWNEDDEPENGESVAEDATASETEEVFGGPEEDARRRDFTVNALFYNIKDFSVIDHVNGLADLKQRTIRTIGVPEVRFEEDPVRMMRALEYSVRLGFTLDPATEEAIGQCSAMITEASPARLTYELLESLHSGRAAGICEAWTRHGIFGPAFPDLNGDREELKRVLAAIDGRYELGARIPDASLMGTLFLPQFMSIYEEIEARDGRFDNAELLARMRDELEPAGLRMHLAKHMVHLIHHGLFTLTKMRQAPERGRQVLKVARQDYFPVAWDLFSIATSAGYFERDVHREWSRALNRVREHGKQADPEQVLGDKPRRRRRRRPRRRRSKQA